MKDRTSADVDAYLQGHLIAADPVMEAVLEVNAVAGLPAIDVSPLQGRFLALLVQMTGASRVLEIGTLGGYSTIWMARALGDGGIVVSLEKEPRHAEVAAANFAAAGLEARIDLRVGSAIDSLAAMDRDAEAPFDLIFVDADKPSNPAYLAAAMRLSRREPCSSSTMWCARGGCSITTARTPPSRASAERSSSSAPIRAWWRPGFRPSAARDGTAW